MLRRRRLSPSRAPHRDAPSGATLPTVTFEVGDLTLARVDAIVNAATPSLLGGGGVDGAIHRAAGPGLVEACRAFPLVAPHTRCPTGEARITPGFDLPARFVIHTVGPMFASDDAPRRHLADAYRNSLMVAEANALRSIAFPAISCGAYGYPVASAAAVAREVTEGRAWALDEIRFVLFSSELLDRWQAAWAPRP